jgi:Flp pilus assembly pilin Flp
MLSRLRQRVSNLFGRLRRDKKGAALLEYALLVAGIALVSLVAVSMLGHKTNDLIASVTAILPGAHADDNGALAAGNLVETKLNNGIVVLDVNSIVANAGTTRLGNNLHLNLESLLIDSPAAGP